MEETIRIEQDSIPSNSLHDIFKIESNDTTECKASLFIYYRQIADVIIQLDDNQLFNGTNHTGGLSNILVGKSNDLIGKKFTASIMVKDINPERDDTKVKLELKNQNNTQQWTLEKKTDVPNGIVWYTYSIYFLKL